MSVVSKIPSSNKIQKQIENLESEQTSTVREKQELQKKLKTLEIIQQNFTALLNAPEMQIPVSGERANSLKRRGTYVTVPLPFPSNLFYCSTLSPLICWWKMYSMWKIELGILSSSIFRSPVNENLSAPLYKIIPFFRTTNYFSSAHKIKRSEHSVGCDTLHVFFINPLVKI